MNGTTLEKFAKMSDVLANYNFDLFFDSKDEVTELLTMTIASIAVDEHNKTIKLKFIRLIDEKDNMVAAKLKTLKQLTLVYSDNRGHTGAKNVYTIDKIISMGFKMRSNSSDISHRYVEYKYNG